MVLGYDSLQSVTLTHFLVLFAFNAPFFCLFVYFVQVRYSLRFAASVIHSVPICKRKVFETFGSNLFFSPFRQLPSFSDPVFQALSNLWYAYFFFIHLGRLSRILTLTSLHFKSKFIYTNYIFFWSGSSFKNTKHTTNVICRLA